jgi:hypothetical protein
MLINITRQCSERRKDGCLAAMESLGLCWLCLTAARLQLPTCLTDLFSIKTLSLSEQMPIVSVPTIFGPKDVLISHRMTQFLQAISRIPSKKPRITIFQRPRRSLTRVFDEVLAFVDSKSLFGNITYASLMTLPHHGGNHRYQPK